MRLAPMLAPFLSVSLWTAATSAQEASPDAARVASEVQASYGALRTLELDFRQDYWSSAYARTTSSTGRISVSRPGRLRFDYVSGHVVVADGARVLDYQPGDDGEPGQYARFETDVLSRAFGFLTGTSAIDRDYTARLVEGSRPLPGTLCLELTPRRRDPQITRMRLYVSSDPTTPGGVGRISVEDREGNWNTFTFVETRRDPELPADLFEFTPPSDARDVSPS